MQVIELTRLAHIRLHLISHIALHMQKGIYVRTVFLHPWNRKKMIGSFVIYRPISIHIELYLLYYMHIIGDVSSVGPVTSNRDI